MIVTAETLSHDLDKSFSEIKTETTYKNYLQAVKHWQNGEVLLPSDIENKSVLDWECGGGVFSFIFSEMNPKKIVAADSWLDEKAVQAKYKGINVDFHKCSLMEITSTGYDVIFANTVTEHLPNLVDCFQKCRELLNPNGILFLNYDNYYQPVGSHDHAFLQSNNGCIEFVGQKCWETNEKCAVSKTFRDEISARFPWLWGADYERELTPNNCNNCPFYKRAQPWSHLIYQYEFTNIFKSAKLTTDYPESTLNKITIFQLKQYLIEAGFVIEKLLPSFVKNAVPLSLLSPPYNFSITDLTTWTIAIRAKNVCKQTKLRVLN